MNSLTIRGGHVIDPANGRNEIADLYVVDGKISADPPPDGSPVISAENLVVTPGLIDMHVHFREPGQTHKETLATGAQAAAAGGFASVVCMPNTTPPTDGPSGVAWILDRARQTASINVFTAGAITRSLAGEEMAPIGSMVQSGIVAIT